jgi:hypothetical protein
MKNLAQFSVIALLASLLVATAYAQSEETKPASDSISEAVNPSKAKARFFIRNEFRKREDGTEINVLEPLYDLPLTDKLVLRTQVPYVWNNPTEGSTVSGLGDITNVLAYRYVNAGGKSYFAALEARWNTAAERETGVGKTLLAPTWFGTIPVPKYNTILFPLVQVFFTVGGYDNRDDINYTVFKGRFLTKLQNRYYIFGEPLIYIDHEDSNDTTGTLELEFGRFVNKQTMVYARPGTGLWGNTGSPYLYDWNFEIGYRYFFK